MCSEKQINLCSVLSLFARRQAAPIHPFSFRTVQRSCRINFTMQSLSEVYIPQFRLASAVPEIVMHFVCCRSLTWPGETWYFVWIKRRGNSMFQKAIPRDRRVPEPRPAPNKDGARHVSCRERMCFLVGMTSPEMADNRTPPLVLRAGARGSSQACSSFAFQPSNRGLQSGTPIERK